MSRDSMSFMIDRRTLAKVAAGGAGVLALGAARWNSPAFAQDATPQAGGLPPLPAGATVVAEGVISPRFIAIDTDGSLLVTEAGTGGDEELSFPAEESGTPSAEATPVEPAPAGTRGLTGQVSRVAADGTVSVVASGIASYNSEGPVGPAGISVSNGSIWITVGGAGPATAMVTPLETENSVLSIDPASGTATKIADIGAFERATNPDPFNIDSDLYGAVLGPDGLFYVCDAGGNTVYKVDLATGDISIAAVLEGIAVPDELKDALAGGNPERGGAMELDPVPTDIVVGADGTAWVTTLAGLAPGAAKVLTIAPDGTVSDLATGLSALVGIATGPDNNLYVSSISKNFFQDVPDLGQVLKVNGDGSTEVVVDGLLLPNGITFDATGNLYVAHVTTPPGPTTDAVGQILRFEGIAVNG